MKSNNNKLRYVVLLVALMLIVSAMTITTDAIPNQPITEKEAGMLVHNALEIFTLIFYGDARLSYPSNHPKDNKMLSGVDSVSEVWYPVYTCVDTSKLPGGSIDGFIDYMKGIYADALAEKYCSSGYLLVELPLFVTDADGDIFIAWNDANVRQINMKTLDDVIVKIIDSNSNNAIAKVYIEVNTSKYEGHKWEKAWVECKFENTSSGWRISDCAFFDMLNSYESNFEWTPIASPSTADPAFDLVFILPTVSVAALASAFCLMRRRRENVL